MSRQGDGHRAAASCSPSAQQSLDACLQSDCGGSVQSLLPPFVRLLAPSHLDSLKDAVAVTTRAADCATASLACSPALAVLTEGRGAEAGPANGSREHAQLGTPQLGWWSSSCAALG